MKLITKAALSIMAATAIIPARAEWAGYIATGAKQTRITEYSNSGKQIVSEVGWIPGIETSVTFDIENWQIFGNGSLYRGNILYQGRQQNGQPFQTETNTELLQLQTGLRYRFSEIYWIGTSFEYNHWGRDIHERNGVIGLQERSRSLRLLLDGSRVWSTGMGNLMTVVGIYRAEPERLRVGFSGVLDPVSLYTRSATGIRLGLTFQPRTMKNWEVAVRYDRIRIDRSSAALVNRGGVLIGTIEQPEHMRRDATITVGYRF